MNLMEMQPGDVVATHADTRHLEEELNYKPSTSIQEGIDNFISWYRTFYKV